MRSPLLPHAPELSFQSFNNKYAGRSCHVIGRGPTTFHYPDLARITDPIFFINDAICLEKFAVSETFFFAHDAPTRVWLDGSINSTAVLPIDGLVLRDPSQNPNSRSSFFLPGTSPEGRGDPIPASPLKHTAPVVYYRRGETYSKQILHMTRDQVALRRELFVHTATIHSLIHFIWFAGFHRITYIGCDGRSGYDPRLQNKSNSFPDTYKTIHKAQQLLTTLFNLQATYHGTPA